MTTTQPTMYLLVSSPSYMDSRFTSTISPHGRRPDGRSHKGWYDSMETNSEMCVLGETSNVCFG